MKESILPGSKGEEPVKEDRRLRNLKYQMRNRVCVLADEEKRSPLQEKRIKTFSFHLQYKML